MTLPAFRSACAGTAASFAYLKQAVGSVISTALAHNASAHTPAKAKDGQSSAELYRPTLAAWLQDCRCVPSALGKPRNHFILCMLWIARAAACRQPLLFSLGFGR